MDIKKIALKSFLILLGIQPLSANMPVSITSSARWPQEISEFTAKYGLAVENFIFDKSSQLMLNYNLTSGQVSKMAKDALGSNNPLVNSMVDVFSNCVQDTMGKIGINFQLPDLGKICGQDITTILINAVKDDVQSLHDNFKSWILNPDTWRKSIDDQKTQNKLVLNERIARRMCPLIVLEDKGPKKLYGGALTVYKNYCIYTDSSGIEHKIPRNPQNTNESDYCKRAAIGSASPDAYAQCKNNEYASQENSIYSLNIKALTGNDNLFGPKIGRETEVKDGYKKMVSDMARIQDGSQQDEQKNLKNRRTLYYSFIDPQYFEYDSKGKNGKIKDDFKKEGVNIMDSKYYPVTLPFPDTTHLNPVMVDDGKGGKKEGYTLTSKELGDLQQQKPLIATMTGIPIVTDNKSIVYGAYKQAFKSYDDNIDEFINFLKKTTKQTKSNTISFLENMKINNVYNKTKRDATNQTYLNYATLSQLGYIQTIIGFKTLNAENGSDTAKYIGLTNLLAGILYQLNITNLQLYSYNKNKTAMEYYQWMFLKSRLLDIEKDLKELKMINSIFLRKILQK